MRCLIFTADLAARIRRILPMDCPPLMVGEVLYSLVGSVTVRIVDPCFEDDDGLEVGLVLSLPRRHVYIVDDMRRPMRDMRDRPLRKVRFDDEKEEQ